MNITMEMKVDALKRLDKSESTKKVLTDLNTGRTTILRWKKKRPEIESWCEKIVHRILKREKQ